MLNYNGNDQGLATEVNEFNHGMGILRGNTALDRVKRRAITNIEARLLSIINTAINVDQAWFAQNRTDILNAFEEFDSIRESIGSPRPHDLNEPVNTIRQNVAQNPINFETIAWQCIKYGAISGGVAGAAGVAATGVSAFSFFGGPIVGGVVTGVTGGISAVGTAAATAGGVIYGACKSPLNN